MELNRRMLAGVRAAGRTQVRRLPDQQLIDVEESSDRFEHHYVQQARGRGDDDDEEQEDDEDDFEIGANMLIAGNSQSAISANLEDIRHLVARRVRTSAVAMRLASSLHAHLDSPEVPLDLKVSPGRQQQQQQQTEAGKVAGGCTSASSSSSSSSSNLCLGRPTAGGSGGAQAHGKAVQAKQLVQGSQATKSKANKQRRLYKCRHCNFETDKKVDNWQHIRIHMRPEKLLACESCQFVTEYKHHLEYHQRNHSGYKPFKCDHCDYQCVNKSMLNSHMKSHSSVYQYQCGDCKYATKYVHSLKMHLRKYNHKPTQLMIDVYGRKRGPKSSSSSTSSTGQQDPQQQQQQQQQQPQQPEQQQQCILDLRVDSKLASQS